MTRNQFMELPGLVFARDVMAITGYTRPTLHKLVDCQIVNLVKPKGCGRAKFRTIQLALMVGMHDWVADYERRFRLEPMLLPAKRVRMWTGYDESTLGKIVAGGGIVAVRFPGLKGGRYRKNTVAEWLGIPGP